MNTQTKNYKYDIAFSFLQKDEGLAVKINDLLENRFSTFLYSKRQEKIAGTDGEKTFHRVFGEEARVVVVFYRNEWGTTDWTRIEQEAIRNRAFKETYDFTVFVPLDNPPIVPEWLPKIYIWAGYDRWGANGVASVIEEKVQHAGGNVLKETVEQKAIRIKKQLDNEQNKKQFLNSHNGCEEAEKEFKKLQEYLKTITEQISTSSGLLFKITHLKGREIDLQGEKYYLSIDWVLSCSNSLDGSEMEISCWVGPPPRYGRTFFEKKSPLFKESYYFDVDWDKKPCWKPAKGGEILYTEKIAERFINLLIDRIQQKNK